MVFVKVRETYDLHTVRNKMTVIAIHTPKPDIIKRNYPGLLMQCRAYRPVSCDVRIACASVLPLDPRGVGLSEDDVAPEDVFNPILYKAMSNKGMSQLEARINALSHGLSDAADVSGGTAEVDVDTVTSLEDDFSVYYGLLADTNGWKHASPQQGLSMSKLRPLVYEMVYNVGDYVGGNGTPPGFSAPKLDGTNQTFQAKAIIGKAKEFPFIPCTVYDSTEASRSTPPGFIPDYPGNAERTVPYIPVVCAGICIPPSRLHELFYRMVVEWTIEFSSIRSIIEITSLPGGLGNIGVTTHYQNYSYQATKKAITDDDDTILAEDSCMVSANVGIEKVM